LEYKDYYKVLGVERNAAQDEIKKRYRKLARNCHPDTCRNDPDAEKRFKEINEAYEVLGDPQKRERYDALGSNWQEGQAFRPPPGFEDIFGAETFSSRGGPGRGRSFSFEFGTGGGRAGGFSDFFESLFGDLGMAGHPSPGASFARGGDMETEVRISVEEACKGTTRELQLQGPGGTKRLSVKIPAGAHDGMKIRLANQGNPGAGGAGDLYLRVRISANGRYRLEGNDIVANLPLAPWDAALGTTKTIETPEGTFSLKVPAGVSSGQRLRLKGKGLAHKGDFYAQVMIMMPKNLSSEEQRLFAELKKVSGFNA
jgi:curved DNA-binding protein